MMYGIDFNSAQRKHMAQYARMPDYMKIELIIKRLCATHEIEWQDMFQTLLGRVVNRHNIALCKYLCVSICYEYFHGDYTKELFGITHYTLQNCLYRGREYANKHPNIQAVITSIHHDIKYNICS